MLTMRRLFESSLALLLTISASYSSMVYAQGITLAQAKALLSAAEAKANSDGTLMNIAVVDEGANLVGFSRMDGAFLGSIDIAIKKARTARLFNMPTADLGSIAQPHKELYGIEVSNGGLITFGGGYPIIDSEGRIIGGIGVSGGSVKQDEAVAEEALKAL